MNNPMTLGKLYEHLGELVEMYENYTAVLSVPGCDKVFIPTDFTIRLKKEIVEINGGTTVEDVESLHGGDREA